MTTEEFRKISPSLPKDPGVYRFLDEDRTILYVGKAKNLKNRLNSYFGVKKHQAYKTKTMVKHAHDIEYTIVETEHDALLLENALIKKNQPRYNVLLKDAKSYTYICIKKERFPRIFFTRNVRKDGSTYLGPYTSKYRTKQIFDLIKNLFPLRTCTLNLSQDNIDEGKFKVCLEYHIKNCKGPCIGEETEEGYNAKVEQIKNILKGNFKPVKDYIKSEMQFFADRMEFEKAQEMKEKLSLFEDYQAKSTVVSQTIKDVDVFTIGSHKDSAFVNYIKIVNGAIIHTDTIELKKNLDEDNEDLLRFAIDRFREKYNSITKEVILSEDIDLLEEDVTVTVPQRGEKKHLLDLSEKNVKYFIMNLKKEETTKQNKQTSAERILKTLQEDLQMDEVPFHIECFDNSNMQGSFPTASCVVFKNAKPSKKDYRHFNVKTVIGPDDFASMTEIVGRRYKRMLAEGESLPQLIIIDGGKGQLSASVKSLKELGILDRVTVIGIAKRLEEIFFPEDPVPIYINKKSESLKLIQQARNEAHRFAITFHRNKRSQNFTKSELHTIPGVGDKTATKLLTEFKSIEKIKNLTLDELTMRTNLKIAQAIYNHFKKQVDESA
ncbi:excinuclease ABC subunit UvrC [Portibacter lacus]|uniref:UvrABC system protein C n=1 Tax=Portibacter lacus TaxID=1099794 RepID=A0AA37SN19_9BACT|nr:excinuclease ABC subunit UvrC [Portibacter lacus]GLR17536.1 UvrABC system protein C [Portibacter lacus]